MTSEFVLPDHGVSIEGNASQSTIITGNDNTVNILTASDELIAKFKQSTALAHYIRLGEFQTLIEERTRNFIGRDFIFKSIEDILRKPAFPSGYIVIRGKPGIGKTSLLAQMVKTKGCVHHFNVASQNIRSIRDFLTNLCAQLIVRYELDYRSLPETSTQNSGFLLQILSEAARKEQREPIIVLIDALDEADDLGLAPSANRLYLPPVLPKGVYFIVTTREKSDYRLLVDNRQDIYFADDDPHNLEDVRQYIGNFITTNSTRMIDCISQWGVDQKEFTTVIAEKSQGNFMYLVHILRDIRDGRLGTNNIDDIRKLPLGLREYYQRHWRQMSFGKETEFDSLYEPIVCILGVSQEPVGISQIAAWTRLEQWQVKRAIEQWREFLYEDHATNKYRIYHVSFQDFIRDQVDLRKYDNIIAEYYLDRAGMSYE